MINRRQTKVHQSPFLLFFGVVFLLFIVLLNNPKFFSNTEKNTLTPTNITVENKIYSNSFPEPGQILASNPINIVINLKNRVVDGSEILILQGNKKVNFFPTLIDTDQTSIRQLVISSLPDGAYTVIYKTCTSPNVCDNGNFNFYINRKLSESYSNFLSNTETTVTINKDVSYPKNLKISAGNSVVWLNHNIANVSIHSFPFPQNNHFPIFNSPTLNINQTYKQIFKKTGIYPYYLDLGSNNIVSGNIVVQ